MASPAGHSGSSPDLFPEPRIITDEPGRPHRQLSGIVESWRLVSVRIGCAPLIALIKRGKRAGGDIQPRDRQVGRLSDLQCDAAQLRQIGGRRESEVQVNTAFEIPNGVVV